MEPARCLVKNLIRDFHRKLTGIYPDQEVRQFIYILFEEYLGWDKARVHLSHDAGIPEKTADLFNLALEELYTGKPIQYIIGKTRFNGWVLKVDSKVLIPRPETEQLTSIIKAGYPEKRGWPDSVLDIGTGSGCIAIDLKKHFSQAVVTAMDISVGALITAELNARNNHCVISFFHGNILDQSTWPDLGKYDLIVSNPPYVMEREKLQMHRNVVEFEPAVALFVEDQYPLVFYKAIAGFAAGHLVARGRLYFEINEQFGNEVCELMQSSGFENIALQNDFHGKERFVSGSLNQ